MAEADDSLMLTILKELRANMRQQRTLLLQLTEAAHRHDRRFDDVEQRFGEVERRFGDIERRISDARAEIELMLKAELLGRMTHFETQMNERIAALEDRLAAGRTTAQLTRLPGGCLEQPTRRWRARGAYCCFWSR